jgi:hypothetical protein
LSGTSGWRWCIHPKADSEADKKVAALFHALRNTFFLDAATRGQENHLDI